MKKLAALSAGVLLASTAQAADYVIDTKGAHAFIVFKIPHLGYSMLLGQFDEFSGSFTYDKDDIEASSISVEINTASLDSNHAERDKHLRSDDFLNTDKYPKATFVSKQFKADDDDEDEFEMIGDLTLHGITRQITIEVEKVGEGADPWGGYRAGFEGEVTLKLKDFGIPFEKLGPSAAEVEMELYIEGIRQ